MLVVIGGIILIILGVVLWVGKTSVTNAMILTDIITGIVILLMGVVADRYRHL
jgi:uncharacterized membrane protein